MSIYSVFVSYQLQRLLYKNILSLQPVSVFRTQPSLTPSLHWCFEELFMFSPICHKIRKMCILTVYDSFSSVPILQCTNVPLSEKQFSILTLKCTNIFFAFWTKALLNFFFLVIMKSSKNLTESVICFLNSGCYSGLRTFHHYRRICNMVLDGWFSVNNGKYQV